MSRFMDYETKVNLAIQNSRIMAVCTYPAQAAALCRCRELIHNHGKIFVKRGEWVHDKSKDAEKIEAVFASLAAQSHAARRRGLIWRAVVRNARGKSGKPHARSPIPVSIPGRKGLRP